MRFGVDGRAGKVAAAREQADEHAGQAMSFLDAQALSRPGGVSDADVGIALLGVLLAIRDELRALGLQLDERGR